VIKHCPHVFIAGDQPRLESKIISGTDGQTSRLITVPSFRETGILALLDSKTLDIECIKFEIFDDGEATAQGAAFVNTNE
jgi:DNA polymerase delta subunit 2